MVDRELTGDEAQRALSEAMRRTRATVPDPSSVATGAGPDLAAHTKAVGAFLSDLYAIMVDPLADGEMTVAEMMTTLRAAAIRDRDREHLLSEPDLAVTVLPDGSCQAAPVPLPDAAQSPDFKALYYELLLAVGHKYPGESRHETALRYIRRAEQSGGPASSASPAAKEPTNG